MSEKPRPLTSSLLQLALPRGQAMDAYLGGDTTSVLSSFGPLSDVNIFVGANNSGKSRLMREIARRSHHKYFWTHESPDVLARAETLKRELGMHSPAATFTWKNNAKGPNARQGHIQKAIEFLLQPEMALGDLVDAVLLALERTTGGDTAESAAALGLVTILAAAANAAEDPEETGILSELSFSLKAKNPRDLLRKTTRDFVGACREFVRAPVFKPKSRYYIPGVRSPIPISGGRKDADLVEAMLRRNLNLEDRDLSVFTGQRLYRRILADRNARRDVRLRFDEFQTFLEGAFFRGKVDLVALVEDEAEEQKMVLQVGDAVERDLYDLGEGIQGIITLMYPIFLAEPDSILCIEEPEMGLHPALQRLFLETLVASPLSERNHTFFVTTHSNHLLEVASSMPERLAVFSFEQAAVGGKTFRVRSVLDDRIKLLDLLGVSNGSVYLANCSIWVEGITDRKYIRAYLKAYMSQHDVRHFVEDRHFCFVEYAGSNIEHFQFEDLEESVDLFRAIFAKSISNRIFLLADRDSGKDARHEALTKVASASGGSFAYAVTPGREVENLVSVALLSAISEKVLEVRSNEISDRLKYEEFALGEVFLGEYLIEKLSGVLTRKICAPSGTLKTSYKNSLADEVVRECSWALMSEDARALAVEIYKFVARHNKS